jgi:TatD DNase family protein
VIDFHCHLDLYPDGLEVARQTNQRNDFTLVVTTSPRAYHATSRVFGRLPRLHVALGLHPEVAEAKVAELDALVAGIREARFVGEIGLDGSLPHRKSLPVQERIFKAALGECARQGGRVMSIHSRGAEQNVVRLIALAGPVGVPVLHWFSGALGTLEDACKLGCWFSVGPAMLAGEKGRRLAARMPMDRVLPETDGPFAKIGSAPLMPWQAMDISHTLSELWGVDLQHARAQLSANLERLLVASGLLV